MHLRYTLLFFLALFIASCQCHDYYKCYTEPANLYFVAFGQGEADTVVVKRYANDNTYTHLVDSSIQGHSSSAADTLYSGIYIEEGYDYILTFPVINKEYTISNIKSEGNYYENIRHSCFFKKLLACFNPLVSYRLNGETREIRHSGNSFEADNIYLVK